MDDTQREPRVNDDSTAPEGDASRSQESPAATVARMLANPRRIRRN